MPFFPDALHWRIRHRHGAEPATDPPAVVDRRIEHPLDAVVAAIAAKQRGIVTRVQLLAIGMGRRAIQRRLDAGRLHLVHRGIYAVGHPGLAPGARELAAVLACGPGAVLSHASAAALWEMLPPPPGPIHVSLAGVRRDGPLGVRLHRVTSLEGDRRLRGGIPVTPPLRTLRDLAGVSAPADLERAVGEALARRLLKPDELDSLAAGAAGRRGVVALRSVLADGPALTRSEAERRLLTLLARAGLPRPRTNVRIGRHEVDAYWPESRLVVEVDGYAFHSGRAAFERDRLRDGELSAAGLRVMRITWRQIADHPEALAARLGAALTDRDALR